MLAFHYHIGLSLALFALGAGAAILIWSKIQESLGTSLARLIAYIIIILSVTNILCAGYYALKYWSAGYMDQPYPTMMQGGMMKCPMMSGQMMGGSNMPMMQQGSMMSDQKMMPINDQMGSAKQMPGSMTQNQSMSNQTMQPQMDMSKMPQNTPAGMQDQTPSTSVEHATHHN